ncbi:unnamed protein product [Symbiodinium sp. CCMP2592]|nr:unnamed protein product [Symbiodinium sp. CCMP2592]
MSWQDSRPTANWMSSVYSPVVWKALPAAEKSTCPLFGMPWTSICNLEYDYMHCKYLGVDRLLYSAVLYLLVFQVLTFGSPEANMAWLWSQIQEHYKAFQVHARFQYLNRISMFFRAQKKTLGLRGKAAEIRSLARPLLVIWAARMTSGIEWHRKLHLLLKLNWKSEDLLDTNKFEFAFSAADANAFRDAMTGFLLLQKELSQHFSDHDPKLFNYTEKSHFLQHLGLQARFVNPRQVWCFSGEDQQRRVQRITAACARGQRPGQAEVKMCQRYRVALHLQFCKHG